MSYLWAILSFLNNIWAAYKEWQQARAEQKIADALAKQLAREQAIEDSKKAETDEDIFRSQHSVVDNKPN